MSVRASDNRVLQASILAPAFYWSLGAFVEPPQMSNTAALLQIIAGLFVMRRYAPQSYEIVILGKRSTEKGAEGSHLAIYGCFLLALGSVWGGGYSLLYHFMDQPQSWIGTTASGFGRALQAAGFWLVLMSPDVIMKQVKLSSQIWTVALIGIVAAVAFTLGSWRAGDIPAPYGVARDDWPVCTEKAPVKISQAGKYHPPSSRHYNVTKPVRCLASIGAAQAAGYTFGG